MLKKVTFSVLALGAALYIGACGYMYLHQRALVFEPSTDDISEKVSLVQGAVNVELTTVDGEHLKAWWVAPQSGHPVYLYLHGNAGSLPGSFRDPAGRAARYRGLSENGAGVLALSWRGYGGSSGEPSEAGLRIDGETALQWLQAQVPTAPIILFGESLGSGIAVQLAAAHEVAALMLDSPYASLVDIGAARYPWLPVRPLIKDPFDSIKVAALVTEPVWAQHCTQDPTVPYSQGQKLLMTLGSSIKELRTVEGRCHVPSLLPAITEIRAFEQRFTALP